MKFNCFYTVLFSVLFTTPQIIAIDLARLYGHEGHEVQKRSGNYTFFLIHSCAALLGHYGVCSNCHA
jgi:hypothetical protein